MKPLCFTFIKLPTLSLLMCEWTAAPLCWMLMYMNKSHYISPFSTFPCSSTHVCVSNTEHPCAHMTNLYGLWAEKERWICNRHTDEVIGLVSTNLPRLSNIEVRPKQLWPNLSKEKLLMRPESQGQLMAGTCLKRSRSQAQLTHYIWRNT